MINIGGQRPNIGSNWPLTSPYLLHWPWQVLHLLEFLAKIKAAILEKLPHTQSRIRWQTDASKVSFFWSYSFYYWALYKEISNRPANGPFHVLLLYYASWTNIGQGVKQDTRVQLQVMNNLIKIKIYLKTLLGWC